jgi:CRP-like cAMP-binding protein
MSSINLFRNSTEYESVAAGTTIFDEGHPGDKMYVVIEGEVEIKVRGKVVETVSEGGIVGEMSLVDGSTRSAAAVAKTDSRLVPIDERRFTYLVQQHPFFAIQVMQIMANRLRQMNAQLQAE